MLSTGADASLLMRASDASWISSARRRVVAPFDRGLLIMSETTTTSSGAEFSSIEKCYNDTKCKYILQVIYVYIAQNAKYFYKVIYEENKEIVAQVLENSR